MGTLATLHHLALEKHAAIGIALDTKASALLK
jgi:hypothetical protein